MTTHDFVESLTGVRIERVSNGLSLLVTLAVLSAIVMWPVAKHVEPPPPPPVQDVAVSLMEPPPEPPPPVVTPEPPPPPPPPVVETQPIIPIPVKPKPIQKKPPEVKPLPQLQPLTPPPPVAQPVVQPTVAAPPISASVEASFVGKLRAYIKTITRYPMSKEARLLKPQGSTEIGFTLSRSGHVQDVAVVHPSGSIILDQQALSIVRSGDYPPIPDDAWSGAPTHPFTVTVEFTTPN